MLNFNIIEFFCATIYKPKPKKVFIMNVVNYAKQGYDYLNNKSLKLSVIATTSLMSLPAFANGNGNGTDGALNYNSVREKQLAGYKTQGTNGINFDGTGTLNKSLNSIFNLIASFAMIVGLFFVMTSLMKLYKVNKDPNSLQGESMGKIYFSLIIGAVFCILPVVYFALGDTLINFTGAGVTGGTGKQ